MKRGSEAGGAERSQSSWCNVRRGRSISNITRPLKRGKKKKVPQGLPTQEKWGKKDRKRRLKAKKEGWSDAWLIRTRTPALSLARQAGGGKGGGKGGAMERCTTKKREGLTLSLEKRG